MALLSPVSFTFQFRDDRLCVQGVSLLVFNGHDSTGSLNSVLQGNPIYLSPDLGSNRLNAACLSRLCGVRSTNSISAACSGLSHWT